MKEETKAKIDTWALEHIPTFLYRIPDRLRTLRMWIRHYWQRVFRRTHVSDYDCWSLDRKLAVVISKHLNQFYKMNRHGMPMGFSDYEESDGYSKQYPSKEDFYKDHIGGGFEKWNEVLRDMIFAFDWVQIDSFGFYDKEDEWFYEKYEYKKEEVTKQVNSEILHHTLEYEKVNDEVYEELKERYEKGMAYFSKYFLSLWD